MELILYLIGNLLCNAGALIPIAMYFSHQAKKQKNIISVDAKMPRVVARDLQRMVFLGSLFRVYWQLSPPTIWTDEIGLIQWWCFFDIFTTPIIWGFLVLVVSKEQELTKEEAGMEWYAQWPFLTLTGLILGFLGCLILPALDTTDAWPLADLFAIANMVIDGLAMVPQLYLTLHDKDRTAIQESSHFVGLLSFGRLWRMVFWMFIIYHQWANDMLSGSHYTWTFVVPDTLHTLVMGDYLYLWVRKLKEEAVDPLFEKVSINV